MSDVSNLRLEFPGVAGPELAPLADVATTEALVSVDGIVPQSNNIDAIPYVGFGLISLAGIGGAGAIKVLLQGKAIERLDALTNYKRSYLEIMPRIAADVTYLDTALDTSSTADLLRYNANVILDLASDVATKIPDDPMSRISNRARNPFFRLISRGLGYKIGDAIKKAENYSDNTGISIIDMLHYQGLDVSLYEVISERAKTLTSGMPETHLDEIKSKLASLYADETMVITPETVELAYGLLEGHIVDSLFYDVIDADFRTREHAEFTFGEATDRSETEGDMEYAEAEQQEFRKVLFMRALVDASIVLNINNPNEQIEIIYAQEVPFEDLKAAVNAIGLDSNRFSPELFEAWAFLHNNNSFLGEINAGYFFESLAEAEDDEEKAQILLEETIKLVKLSELSKKARELSDALSETEANA